MRRERHAVEWMTDCEKCMQTRDRTTRQVLGCGYEPPLVELRGKPFKAMPWAPGDRPPIDKHDTTPTTCAGYLVKLPEVIEASRARMWMDKGELRTFTRGEQPTEQLAMAIEILEIEIHRHQDVVANRPKQGS